MCGRARCVLARERAAQAAGVPSDQFVNGDKYSPVENMGPGRFAPVVLGGGGSGGGNVQRSRRLEAMQWGLVPSFTKPNATPDHFAMFNARSDTLQERPAFRRLVDSRRCVALCDGYYEWQQVDKREKQPFYFFRDSGVMKFAALYDTWTNSEGDEMHTFTILTTDAAPHIRWLHTRMPVILTEEGVARWTSDAKFAQVKDLLVPYTASDLKWHPVDKRLGSTKFQSEDCAKKVDIKHAGNIKAFFGGVKTEKKEAPLAPGSTPAAAAAGYDGIVSDPSAVHDRHVVKQKRDPNSTTLVKQESPKSSALFSSPVRRRQQQQQIAPVRDGQDVSESERVENDNEARNSSAATGFVMASSLLGKRAAASPVQDRQPPPPLPLPRSSPSRPSPSKKPRAAAPKDPKQGTLLAFFQPKK